MITRELAETIRGSVRALPGVTDVDHELTSTDSGNPGFEDECEAYEALCFTAVIDGRTFHVTIEDVTLPPGA